MVKRSGQGAGKVLAEDIFLTLKEDILNADLPPETVLDEVKVMERFRVSRTPVREAIRRLAASGLVTIEPHRSAYVRPLSFDDIADFFEAYRLVQRMVFILSAERVTKPQLEDIAQIERRLEVACRAKNIKAVRVLNSQFHVAVALGCTNRYLQETYIKLVEDSNRLSSLLLRYTIDTNWKAHVAHLQADHDRILVALSKKDHKAMGEYSDEHVAFFKEQVFKAVQKTTPLAAAFDPRGAASPRVGG